MKLIWTHHALRQLNRRTSVPADRILLYFTMEAAVLSREERNGNREYVIYSPNDKECFAVIITRGKQVVTIMPIVWRRIAPGFIAEARRLYHVKMEEAA